MSLPAELEGALDDEAQAPSPPADYALSANHTLASQLRVPMWGPDQQVGRIEKIAALEDYMLMAAFYVGVLHEERLHAHVELAPLQREWETVQPLVRGKTARDAEDSRRRARPELASRIAILRWRVDRLSEELQRLDREHDKVSRAYTLMTGT